MVEDSNSGYDFFSDVSKEKNWNVISACGKSNIFKILEENDGKRIAIIADGAAFGPEMDRVMKKVEISNDKAIFLPESFEWLILKSKIVRDNSIDSILDNPSEYIESKDYMSWERFFTALLIDKMKGTYLQYSKSKLNEAYINKKLKYAILKEIPENFLGE